MREYRRMAICLLLSALLLTACEAAPQEPDDPVTQQEQLHSEQQTESPATDNTETDQHTSAAQEAPAEELPAEDTSSARGETAAENAKQPAPQEAAPDRKTNIPAAKTPLSQPAVHIHSYTERIVPPTCTDCGYTLHTCACGDSYRDRETAAPGHSYESITVAPTTSSRGYTKHTCTRCGTSYQDQITPPLAPQELDIGAYVAWAKQYAQSIGLILDASTMAGWDTPMIFTAEDEPYIKQWIQEDLDIHLREGDVATWIWAEKTADGAYEFFTGRG